MPALNTLVPLKTRAKKPARHAPEHINKNSLIPKSEGVL
jgi:hypothetical protein